MKINLERKVDKKEKNIGIEILRIYLSMTVVNSHCYHASKNIRYIILKILKNRLHVPTFFIISFFYFQITLISRNIEKFRKRFERLLIPYLFWPLINWLLNNLIMFLFKIKLRNSFQDLKIQLLTGHCFNGVFWFQWDLIFEVFLFIIIEIISHKYLIYIIINSALLAYLFQYSQYNYKIFSKLCFEQRYTFGRFAEIIPYSVSGFILSYFQIIVKLKKNRIKIINLCLLIFASTSKYDFFLNPKGFQYQGLKLNILCICFFIIFSMIPNNIFKDHLIKVILQISKFTPGIYYLHVPIKNYFKYCFKVIKKKEIYGAILIYIISFNISIIGNFIFKKTMLINLFQ